MLLVMMGWVAVQERFAFRAREDDPDLFAVTHYLNTATPPTALIETYDSELFLFLHRPYTYAPPRVLVEIIRREQGEAKAVTYDPLESRPDYLVVGEYGHQMHLDALMGVQRQGSAGPEALIVGMSEHREQASRRVRETKASRTHQAGRIPCQPGSPTI